jgi:hypothetical protein
MGMNDAVGFSIVVGAQLITTNAQRRSKLNFGRIRRCPDRSIAQPDGFPKSGGLGRKDIAFHAAA